MTAPLRASSVEPADSPPVRYKGRIHVRTGPRRGIASAQDERILNEKRRHRDRPFDVTPIHAAGIAELNRSVFESSYLPSAFAPDILEANDRSYEQRLAARKMVESAERPVPTVLGLLVLSHSGRDYLPGSYIQFLRLDGDDLSDPVIDEQVIEGTVADILRRVDDKLAPHKSDSSRLHRRIDREQNVALSDGCVTPARSQCSDAPFV